MQCFTGRTRHYRLISYEKCCAAELWCASAIEVSALPIRLITFIEIRRWTDSAKNSPPDRSGHAESLTASPRWHEQEKHRITRISAWVWAMWSEPMCDVSSGRPIGSALYAPSCAPLRFASLMRACLLVIAMIRKAAKCAWLKFSVVTPKTGCSLSRHPLFSVRFCDPK